MPSQTAQEKLAERKENYIKTLLLLFKSFSR